MPFPKSWTKKLEKIINEMYMDVEQPLNEENIHYKTLKYLTNECAKYNYDMTTFKQIIKDYEKEYCQNIYCYQQPYTITRWYNDDGMFRKTQL